MGLAEIGKEVRTGRTGSGMGDSDSWQDEGRPGPSLDMTAPYLSVADSLCLEAEL